MARKLVFCLVAWLALPIPGHSETREEWIVLGARVHGGFGAFIPLGIRIGEDALRRLDAQPREVAVVYYDNPKSPCACMADGVALATTASVGQRTLEIAAEKALEEQLAVIQVSSKKTGFAVRYVVPMSALPRIGEWNKTLNEAGRYDAVMSANGLFEAIPTR